MPNKKVNLQSTVNTIHRAAVSYKANLVGKTFLYVFDDRYIEVIYKAINFKHLTGVESALSSKRFYSLALSNHLKPNQIFFSPRHPYALCQRKLKHLEDLIDVASSENFMLEEISTQTKVYKFGTTDTKFTLCLTEDLDASGNLKSNLMTVQSLRDEDCFSKAKDAFVVTHILSKPNDQKQYDVIQRIKRCSIQHINRC
jgi:hypothetical protein